MDLEKALAELTLDEKARLTAGADMWSTPAIERLDLPSIRVTDGPNGARGSSLLGVGDATAVCIPCGSALGATWNPSLVERVGEMLGQEARSKACRVLLAPTINMHRSPLGGRNFECYSEDPLLSGKIAAGFVRGVQSEGVATTAKHFVANDAEHERNTIDSIVDSRTLREIYLVPFELAVKEGGTLGIMTAYNRLNGTFCSEDAWLLSRVLRDEWGFEGFVLTDWFSVGSTLESARAGLDLQMPGPGRFFGAALAEAVRARQLDESIVTDQVARMLGVWKRLGALDDSVEPERSIDLPEHRELAREVATDSIVLLQNNGMLPLATTELRRIALIGPNADRCHIMGGGSAMLRAHYEVTPLDALRKRLGDAVEITHERGCWTEKSAPPLHADTLAKQDGSAGLEIEFFGNLDWQGEPVHLGSNRNGQIVFFGAAGEGVPEDFSFRATGTLTPTESGVHTFTLVQAGLARVRIDGDVVLDGIESPPGPGSALFGMGSREIEASVDLVAGRPVELTIDFSCGDGGLLRGVVVGHRPPVPEDMMERAVAAAAAADVAVLVVGTSGDWEAEGHDRESMQLPGEQDELVRSICAANPRTVVCVNTGSPVAMDWCEDAAALMQIWFGGQEMADALVDVLLGSAEPGGRLPTTLPLREEHSPAFGNFAGENSELRYGEGLLVGYRWYSTRGLPVRFPFGHGLSYSNFEIGAPRLSADEYRGEGTISVEVPVTNTGSRRGCEVVQCYVAPTHSSLFRPLFELRAFAKVWLDPGQTSNATLELGPRAFAHWDPADPDYESVRARLGPMVALAPGGAGSARRPAEGWYVDAGSYELRVGRSSADIVHLCVVNVPEEVGPIAA
ncbi:MAG: glycoside hydrolase family 3 C-terminal domain-containing protein [Myxococcota bacterium]